MGTGTLKVQQLSALNRLFSKAYPHKKAQEIIAKLCKFVDECEGRAAEDKGIISLLQQSKQQHQKEELSNTEWELITKAANVLGIV